jgi:hypothetical protein
MYGVTPLVTPHPLAISPESWLYGVGYTESWQAHWFYEDNVRPESVETLKSLSLLEFAECMFRSCDTLKPYEVRYLLDEALFRAPSAFGDAVDLIVSDFIISRI